MGEAVRPSSPHSLLRPTSLLLGLFLCLALLALGGESTPGEVASATTLLLLLVANTLLAFWESFLRSREVERRVERVAEVVARVRESKPWDAEEYPHLHTPPSSSLVLQWTHRDGRLVNLPWALLVRGDSVVLRPGQAAPALCRAPGLVLQRGELHRLGPPPAPAPELRAASSAQAFVLEETPCLAELEHVLEAAASRPSSTLTKQRLFLAGTVLELVLLPAVLVLVLIWSCLRRQLVTSLLPLAAADSLVIPRLFVREPVAACLPLLPLTLPLWWILVNTAALANVLTIFRQPSAVRPSTAADPFDDMVETPEMEEAAPTVSWRATAAVMASCLAGRGEFLCRTENLLHCLGSVTSYCCTDKKGVLSWPNTSPEKLMFLRQVEAEAEAEASSVVPEILTVNHNVHNPFSVDFDDTAWEQHLASLRPLGLAGLLNSCSLASHPAGYSPIYSALQFDASAARGCVCELGRIVGLPEQEEERWRLEQVCTSSRPSGKTPSPHMVSLVVAESSAARTHLMSQGSADLVLESCADAWTGRDLAPLEPSLRKKCLEFHHRAALTSHCTAFAYRPLPLPPPWPPHHHLHLPPHPTLTTWPSEASVDHASCTALHPSPSTAPLSPDLGKCLEAQGSQTLLGMVQMQYQARVDMVQFIDLLEKACIRFVHFSKDNELRSRVFSEKMGLESGWNCHISLAPGADLSGAQATMYGVARADRPEGANQLCVSLPAKLDRLHGRLGAPAWGERPAAGGADSPGGSSSSLETFGISNRAQLPAGIDAIRPHLEKMDNVPLLVSLFTDCTPSSTRQMVEIMQENGEVVAMLGSSANFHNMRSFLSADASLAVEPLYPQVCRRVPVCAPAPPSPGAPSTGPPLLPTLLAQQIVAVAASVTFAREEKVSIYQAIIASRRHVLAIKYSLQFWVSSCLFLSLLVVASLVVTAPLPLTAPQLLLLCSLHIPLLATAIFLSSHDSNICNISTGKNGEVSFSKSSVCESCWWHGLRLTPYLVALLAAHLLTILPLCSTQAGERQCSEALPRHLAFQQAVNMMFVTVALVLASATYVSSTDQVWRYKLRRVWHVLVVGLVLVACQAAALLPLPADPVLPTEAWALLGAAAPLTVLLNEVIKRQQVKANVRHQKRARLEFGTKLGINSPF